MLKKEFQKKDVERMRNLIKGKSSVRTSQGVGYKKVSSFHEEGDVWEEDGRTWTIKNGIKQNITKLDQARKKNQLPMFCPSCNKLTYKNRDKDVYKIHNKCLNCVIDMEAEIHKAGLWEEYQKNIKNADIDGLTNMYKTWMLEQINMETNSYITEGGNKEKWVGGVNKQRAMEAMEATIKYLQSLKK